MFARVDRSQTVSLSQPTPNARCTSPACTAAPRADANFEGASADGTKAYFTSTAQLTDTATADAAPQDSATRERNGCQGTTEAGGCNLYLYDFAAPADARVVDVSTGDVSGRGPEVQGVAALAETGKQIYFVAKGVLAANAGAATDSLTGLPQHASAGEDNLYLYTPLQVAGLGRPRS